MPAVWSDETMSIGLPTIDADLNDAKELLDFLSNWLIVHIQSRDPEFVAWVKGAAAEGAA